MKLYSLYSTSHTAAKNAENKNIKTDIELVIGKL